MARGKQMQQVVKMVSTAKTGFFYTTSRSRMLGKKLQLRKYDPVVQQHVLFKEEKISRTKVKRKK